MTRTRSKTDTGCSGTTRWRRSTRCSEPNSAAVFFHPSVPAAPENSHTRSTSVRPSSTTWSLSHTQTPFNPNDRPLVRNHSASTGVRACPSPPHPVKPSLSPIFVIYILYYNIYNNTMSIYYLYKIIIIIYNHLAELYGRG